MCRRRRRRLCAHRFSLCVSLCACVRVCVCANIYTHTLEAGTDETVVPRAASASYLPLRAKPSCRELHPLHIYRSPLSPPPSSSPSPSPSPPLTSIRVRICSYGCGDHSAALPEQPARRASAARDRGACAVNCPPRRESAGERERERDEVGLGGNERDGQREKESADNSNLPDTPGVT